MNYIIGGGVAGLICSFYTGYTIISKNIGGQMNNADSWHLGPRFLHIDKFSTKLLNDLGIKAKKRKINIGYYNNGYCENDEEFKQIYYLKTRKNARTYIKSSSSRGKKSFWSYQIDMNFLIKKIKNRIADNIINQNVKNLDLDNKIITLEDGTIISGYKHIISTIPAPIFKKISNIRMAEFNYLKKTFILFDNFVLNNFDYVYVADNSPYHRVARSEKNPKFVVLEFVGNDIDKFNDKYIEKKEVKIGQIQDSGKLLPKIKDIAFLGRYAEWKHDILINDIVRKSLNIKKEQKIKVCAIDLDGVLCEYPKGWVDFANNQLGTKYNLFELKDNISYNKYREIKTEYRNSGIKSDLPMINYAKKLIDKLKKQNYIIIILSARPVFKYPKVMQDTLTWFKKNKIYSDMYFWGKDKHVKILKYFPNLEFMIEDNADAANKIGELGYKVYLVDNEYNQEPINDNVIRIKKLNEVKHYEKL